ncbi:TBC1 domain family member 9B [Liparis tanakae]|uniref:TBC1 domain family member 9B n=1 Tax=Liparis tanakae TaxID=230148 RepID=A0A4Z2EYH9_9TELE|nr:TBC1 domain family member 9B [Liparis tanakae]
MTSCYWGSSSSAVQRHDPSLPYLEQYRIDPVQFTQLFTSLAPWVCGGHTSTLSARLFRLLDHNKDGLVNFKEFITGLSGMFHGDLTEKLKLLFKLHLPPALCPEEAESALEATHFFTEEEPQGEKGQDGGGDAEEKKEVKDYRYYLRMWAEEKEPKAESIRDLPRMSQEQFISLCKTLYNLFGEDPLEQQLYHSIATVASLLLRIGEVGKRFAQAPPPPPPREEGAEPDEETEDDAAPTDDGGRRRGSVLDVDWSITFEQVLASLLTEAPLVDFFEKRRDFQGKMAASKAQRAVERQTSSTSDHELTQHSA